MSTVEQTSSPIADPILPSVETVEQTTLNSEPVTSGPEVPAAGQHLSLALMRLTEVMIQARELLKKCVVLFLSTLLDHGEEIVDNEFWSDPWRTLLNQASPPSWRPATATRSWQ